MTITRMASSPEGRAGIAAIRAMLTERKDTPDTPIAERRARMEAFAADAPEVPGVVIERSGVGERAILTAVPADAKGKMLFLHGGAYVLGSTTTHIKLAARYAVASRRLVHVLDYRLAPENPYPAAVDDALNAWILLTQDSSNVALAGDSAGGGLALATAIAIRDRGLTRPSTLGLIAPWVDLTVSGDSLIRNARHDVMLTREGLCADAEHYRGSLSASDPRISPLFADLTGLPPMFIQAGGREVLLDDALRLETRAREAGVPCDVEVWEDMTHAFGAFGGMVPESIASIASFGTAMRMPLNSKPGAALEM